MKPIPNHTMLGHVIGVHGVRGAVKLYSECRPREQIFDYDTFLLRNEHSQATLSVELSAGRVQGKGLVAQFVGYDDRDSAYQLINHTIWVHQQQLPSLPDGEYYWQELIGLEVWNLTQTHLGSVHSLIETGANDVLIVRSETEEILIPFIMDYYILEVDTEKQVLTVDWQVDWSSPSGE